MDLVPVDPPSYRSKRRVRSSWLKEWWPGLLFFALLDIAFGWWYVREYRSRQQVPLTVPQSNPNGLRREGYTSSIRVDEADLTRRIGALSRSTQIALSGVSGLEPGQECLAERVGSVGIVIVRSMEANVPTIRQFFENGRPVKCVGDHRVQ